MSLKIISEYFKRLLPGYNNTKIKYKKQRKKHYRTNRKERKKTNKRKKTKKTKKIKRKMNIRAGVKPAIEKKNRKRDRIRKYPGVEPTINADEINNLEKLIKMREEIEKKIKKLPQGEKFPFRVYEVLEKINEYISDIYISETKSEDLPGSEGFKDLSHDIEMLKGEFPTLSEEDVAAAQEQGLEQGLEQELELEPSGI